MRGFLIISILILAQITLGQVLTIDSILLKINRSNPSLAAYNSKINALNTYAQGAKNWDPPSVGVGLWMTPYKDPSMGMAMLSIEQMFPSFSRINAKQEYMSAMSSEQVENKNFAKNQLYALAKRNYYRWVILKVKLVILKESQSIVESMIQTAELNYSNSDGKLNTIFKSKAKLANLQANVLSIQSEVRQKNVMLNILMNQDRNVVFDIDTAYSIKNYENDVTDSSILSSVRSDLKSIDRSYDILKLKQKIEVSRRNPSFGVRYNDMTPFNKMRPSMYNIMGMMTIPIVPWSSREYKSNIKALNFEMEELQFKKKSALNDALGKTSALAMALKNSKDQINIYKESIIPALQNNLKTSQLGYSQNKENLFVLLDAWEALNNAKMEYLNKIEELLYLQVEYERELEQK